MHSCQVAGCWQPGFYSAFYDVTVCEDHLRGVAKFYGLFGRKPNADEFREGWKRVIVAYTERELPGFERDAA